MEKLETRQISKEELVQRVEALGVAVRELSEGLNKAWCAGLNTCARSLSLYREAGREPDARNERLVNYNRGPEHRRFVVSSDGLTFEITFDHRDQPQGTSTLSIERSDLSYIEVTTVWLRAGLRTDHCTTSLYAARNRLYKSPDAERYSFFSHPHSIDGGDLRFARIAVPKVEALLERARPAFAAMILDLRAEKYLPSENDSPEKLLAQF